MTKVNSLLLAVVSFATLSLGASQRDFIVVRHGESDHNVTKLLNSNPTHPNYTVSNLTENGKKTVKATAQKLQALGYNDSNIAAVFVSPLPRTKQTAQLLADEGLFSENKIVIDPRIIEDQVGDLEGKPNGIPRDVKVQHGGESLEQVDRRVKDFYKNTLEQHPEGNIIVVTHQTPGEAFLAIIDPQKAHLKTGEAVVVPLGQTVNTQ